MKEFKYKPLKEERGEDDYDGEEDYDDDDIVVEDEAREYSRENVGSVAGPYIKPYVYMLRFLDTQYGVSKVGDIFTIGDSPIVVDTDGDITVKERVFKDRRVCGNC